MSNPIGIFLFGLLIVSFLCPKAVLAEFSFSSSKQSIDSGEELELSINLSLQGQANKIYYLEGALKKEGGSNYFGLSWNDASWSPYTSSNFSTLKSITTNSDGRWVGLLKFKVDQSSSLFVGSGNYILQIKRFTTSGSSSWSDNLVVINVVDRNPVTPSPQNQASPVSQSKAVSSFTISEIPISISSVEAFSTNVKVQNLNPNAKYFLKGAFSKEGSTNYLGKTWVNETWVKNSETATSQYPIITDQSGNWSGELKVIPDSEDGGFDGSGKYIFKVARYNSSGSGLVWSNSLPVNITHISAPKSSSKVLLSSGSPIVGSEEYSTQEADIEDSKIALNIQRKTDSLSEVSGVSTSSSQAASIKSIRINWFAIGGGLLMLIFGLGYLVYKKKKG